MAYIPRSLEPALKTAARQFPSLALTGPRQTGKSTLLKHLFPGHRYLTLDDPAQRLQAANDPELFLENAGEPLLLDEIQYAPGLLPHIKIAIDKKPSLRGRFILTGSQIFPLMAGLSESLAGRVALFELLGFSWEELGRPAPPSASALFKKLRRGFYPAAATRKLSPELFYSSYLSAYLERDIRQVQNVQDLAVFQNFVQLLAARVGSPLNLNDVARFAGISFTTAQKWLSLLESTRIAYLLRPYTKNVTKRVVKSPKLYFTDTGLLAHLLRYSDEKTLLHGPMAGVLFENFIVVEVLKMTLNHKLRGDLSFYRDSNGNEADIVIEQNQTARIVEAKLGKTPRLDWAGPLEKIRAALGAQDVMVFSLIENALKIGPSVSVVPFGLGFDRLSYT